MLYLYSQQKCCHGAYKSTANEWAGYNINVNADSRHMATNNTESLRGDENSKEILSRIPAGRWGMPDDVAGAAIFLASDAAAYIHGFTLAVDGGWLAR